MQTGSNKNERKLSSELMLPNGKQLSARTIRRRLRYGVQKLHRQIKTVPKI